MLLFYSHIPSRLRYIVGFISKELFDEAIELTTDKEEYGRDQPTRLNYSEAAFSDDDFFIRCTPLLFETGLSPRELECFRLNELKAFFGTEGDFPFDIFATSLYLLSRNAAYLPHGNDH